MDCEESISSTKKIPILLNHFPGTKLNRFPCRSHYRCGMKNAETTIAAQSTPPLGALALLQAFPRPNIYLDNEFTNGRLFRSASDSHELQRRGTIKSKQNAFRALSRALGSLRGRPGRTYTSTYTNYAEPPRVHPPAAFSLRFSGALCSSRGRALSIFDASPRAATRARERSSMVADRSLPINALGPILRA